MDNENVKKYQIDASHLVSYRFCVEAKSLEDAIQKMEDGEVSSGNLINESERTFDLCEQVGAFDYERSRTELERPDFRQKFPIEPTGTHTLYLERYNGGIITIESREGDLLGSYHGMDAGNAIYDYTTEASGEFIGVKEVAEYCRRQIDDLNDTADKE